jgi:membrane-bound lytic murein transglycosylase MltF
MEDQQPPPPESHRCNPYVERRAGQDRTKVCGLNYFKCGAIDGRNTYHRYQEYTCSVSFSAAFERLTSRGLSVRKILSFAFFIALWSASVCAQDTGDFRFPEISYRERLATEERGDERTDPTPYGSMSTSERPNADEPVLSVSESYCNLATDYDISAIKEVLSRLSRLSDTYTDDLPDLLKRGTIRVLTTYSPANFFVSKGWIYGFEYSLLKEYERLLNRGRNRDDLKIVLEYIPVPEELLIPCLEKGIGDVVAAGSVVTGENTTKFEFTDPYLTGVSEVLVSRDDAKPIQSLYDLAGRQIYVPRIKSHYESLARLNEQLRAMGLAQVTIIMGDEFLNSADILEMLNAGIIDLSLVESHLAALWSGILPKLRVHAKLPLRQGAGLAWMVRKNNPLLKASLNKFTRGHKKGTLLGNIYFNRYFKDTKWITNPLDSNGREKSLRYAPRFKKYGAKYNIDWMLLCALGYQESRLDQSRRSPKGAIGIMQILPSTAMDPRINISDCHLLENNIHAGTKYLALLRDTYFNDSEMEPITRLRYALAAYNAGPANIREARVLAAKMGFNPNRWFGHGEMGALKLIGQEPVRYVSNINKYYLAYSLADTLDCLKGNKSERLDPRQTKSDVAP